jgi:hypothetical protein
MYSLGMTGSCFWKSVLRFVSRIIEAGSPSFSTGMILMTPLRSSAADGFSGLSKGYK